VILSSQEKTSILITTHYIEEARRAHVISLMRSGKLLVENSPNFLLKHFAVDNLEDVFLNVCRFEAKEANCLMPKTYAESRSTKNDNKQISANKPDAITKLNSQDLVSSHWNRLWALTHKNYVRLVRNLL